MQNRKMRATWVSSVINLDWPSASSPTFLDNTERIKRQKEELISILDDIVAMNMNAVIFPVVPCADALYASDLLPRSKYLTGTLGKNPGFDPLTWAVEQAHARNIELQAWLNPYRISMNTRDATVDELNNSSPDSAPSVYRTHPEWTRVAYNRFVLRRCRRGLPVSSRKSSSATTSTVFSLMITSITNPQTHRLAMTPPGRSRVRASPVKVTGEETIRIPWWMPVTGGLRPSNPASASASALQAYGGTGAMTRRGQTCRPGPQTMIRCIRTHGSGYLTASLIISRPRFNGPLPAKSPGMM